MLPFPRATPTRVIDDFAARIEGITKMAGADESEPNRGRLRGLRLGRLRVLQRTEKTMRLIIEARLEGIDGVTEGDGVVGLAVIERRDLSVSNLGLTLSESRALLAKLQGALVSQQVAGWMAGQTNCPRCGSTLAHKDSRTIALRTVFGKVLLQSPRLWSCRCAVAAGAARHSVSPLCKALPSRATPELEYLQVKWAAHLPFRQTTKLLKEVLPLDIGISASDTRRKVGIVGKHLDAEVEHDIASRPLTVVDQPVRESTDVACVSVDSAWLHHHSSPKGRQAVRALAKASLAVVPATHLAAPREHSGRPSDVCWPSSPRVRVRAQRGRLGWRATGLVSRPKRRRAQRAGDRDQRRRGRVCQSR